MNERLLDSIIYLTRPEDTFNLPTGSFLGDLTDELEGYGPGAYITKFVSGGPKNYGFQVLSPTTGVTKEAVKIKGFTINSATSAILNFQTLDRKVAEFLATGSRDKTAVEQTKISRVQGHKVCKNLCLKSLLRKSLSFACFTEMIFFAQVVTETLRKDYRITYDKRRVFPDGTTLPYGF